MRPTTTRALIALILASQVEAGHVLAILGPSGAGKTTLLNMLTLEKKGGKPTGLLTLNGHPFTLELYRKYSAYVQQNDALWACMNARDHLVYAHMLYQPDLGPVEREAAVASLLNTLGLTEMQMVKAGNQFSTGAKLPSARLCPQRGRRAKAARARAPFPVGCSSCEAAFSIGSAAPSELHA